MQAYSNELGFILPKATNALIYFFTFDFFPKANMLGVL